MCRCGIAMERRSISGGPLGFPRDSERSVALESPSVACTSRVRLLYQVCGFLFRCAFLHAVSPRPHDCWLGAVRRKNRVFPLAGNALYVMQRIWHRLCVSKYKRNEVFFASRMVTMQVLIAVDGSSVSLDAASQAGQILSPQRDKITLYYSPPGAGTGRSAAGGTVERGRLAMAESVFAKATLLLPAEWRPLVQTLVGNTDPREGILQAADQCRSDLVVVGARGLSRFERLVLGSVSRAVVHAAQIPVLVVRVDQKRPESTNFRVLLAFESVDRGRQLAGACAVLPGRRGPVL